MKKLLVFALTLLAVPGWAECYKDNDGAIVCRELRESSQVTDRTYQPSTLTKNGYRYWIKRDIEQYRTKYLEPSEYGWVRYYEVDCKDSSEAMLDNQYNGDWGDEIIQRGRQMIGERHYFMAKEYQAIWCNQIARINAQNARHEQERQEQAKQAAQLEQQKVIEERDALKAKLQALEAQSTKNKANTAKLPAKKK